MRKRIFIAGLSLLIWLTACPLLVARDGISPEKEKEIRRMLQLTGMEKLMDQMKGQMIDGLRKQLSDAPDEFWTKFQKKMDTKKLIEMLLPIYDKYYSTEDLRAVNAFYSTEVGQRLVASLPKVTQESMQVGMQWGRRVGEEAEKEVREEKRSKNKGADL